MYSLKLPRQVDFEKMAQTRAHLAGKLAIADFERINSSLASTEGHVEIDLVFSKDAKASPVCSGTFKLECVVACQRCLGPMPLYMTGQIGLTAVTDVDAALTISNELEPIITGGEMVSLVEMVEEELLLILPLTPKHPEEACPVKVAKIDIIETESLLSEWQAKLKSLI